MKKTALLLCTLIIAICMMGCSEESASKLNKTNTEAVQGMIAELDKYLAGDTNTGELTLAIAEHGKNMVFEANDDYTAFSETMTELLQLIPGENKTELKRIRNDMAGFLGE